MNANRFMVKLFIILAALAVIVMNLLLLFNWSEFFKGLM